MRMQSLIAATITAALTAGCGLKSTSGCEPPEQSYSVDARLSEAEIAQLVTTGDHTGRGEVTCLEACAHAYHRDRSWYSIHQTTCSLELDPAPGATPDALVAHVTCSGRGIEYYCEGRRPLGHVELVRAHGDDDDHEAELGRHLARCAHLEAASVVAFAELAARLTAWGAPAALIERCHRAAAEETRHAEQLGALALRAGAEVPPPRQQAIAVDLLAAALENAVEGCVHEAWAALRAAWIAGHAHDPELRRVYAEIAADEAGHAQLAWDLHTWFLGQVDPGQRGRLAAALPAAIAGLVALASARAPAAPAVLGLPDAAGSAALAARFAAGLALAA